MKAMTTLRVVASSIAAVCDVHQVSHLLTFNVAHFTRFAGFPPGLVVVDPTTV